MTLLDTLARIAVSWLVIATIVAGAWAFAITRLRQRRTDVAPRINRDVEIRQPDIRDWQCSDGRRRTEVEALAWCEATYGGSVWRLGTEPDDSDWLPEWVNDNDEPLYVPSEWVA